MSVHVRASSLSSPVLPAPTHDFALSRQDVLKRGEIVHQGWLTKRGHINPSMKKRYCVAVRVEEAETMEQDNISFSFASGSNIGADLPAGWLEGDAGKVPKSKQTCGILPKFPTTSPRAKKPDGTDFIMPEIPVTEDPGAENSGTGSPGPEHPEPEENPKPESEDAEMASSSKASDIRSRRLSVIFDFDELENETGGVDGADTNDGKPASEEDGFSDTSLVPTPVIYIYICIYI